MTRAPSSGSIGSRSLIASAGQTVETRLDEFARLRRRNLEELESLALTNCRSRSCGSPSRARSGHAAAAPGDVDRARPRSRHADLARAREAVFRRGRPVACLFADHQRDARVVADRGHDKGRGSRGLLLGRMKRWTENERYMKSSAGRHGPGIRRTLILSRACFIPTWCGPGPRDLTQMIALTEAAEYPAQR